MANAEKHLPANARKLVLKGVRQNNLKNVDLELPLGRSIVVTGPSGSGKSSLAFETIYAEGQRRYMQSLSTYARQFLEKFRAPEADKIENVPPSIALEQLNPVRNSRATVGTTTELYDYLRLLFEKVGVAFCPDCDVPMVRTYPERVLGELKADGSALIIGFDRKLPKKLASATEFLQNFLSAGYTRMIYGGELHSVEESAGNKKFNGKEVTFVADRVRLPEAKEKPDEGTQTRLSEAIRSAWEMGEGCAVLLKEKAGKKFAPFQSLYKDLRCPKCAKLSPPKTAASFSFNNPLGACENCKGFGNTLEIDPDLIIPDPRKSIAQGAIEPFTKPSLSKWQKRTLDYCKKAKIDVDLPYKDLPKKHQKAVFEGEGRFKGARGVFKMLDKEKYKMRIRVFVSRYVSPSICTVCDGKRLNDSALSVRVGKKNLAEVCALTIKDCKHFLETLKLDKREKRIGEDVLGQLIRRLEYLETVGIGYITLSRLTKTLSGGEYQRILLATQLSQGLCDTLYVLDEPSIGLHPKDTQKLLAVLNRILELGNSLVVVEHDPEVIEWGEYVIDLGPGSGSMGGEIIFSGERDRFMKSGGRTAKAIKNWREYAKKHVRKTKLEKQEEWLELKGACGNNLKKIDVKVPLNRLVTFTGVSGSGKSTLVVDTIYQALAKIFHGRSKKIHKFESIAGFEFIESVEMVDQSPIGRSSRSNPITFIKGYDEIRKAFSETKEAQTRGFTPGHFSFNVAGGRCENCEGEGRVKVDMVFMEDVWVPCEVCGEKRFKPQVLNVRYRGKNIHDVLTMTVDDAHSFFSMSSSLKEKLALLKEVGLGYLTLGQPGYTLSGGEAQRLKIARELMGQGKRYRKPKTLFILDEPTTGLHFDEIEKLLSVFRTLLQHGHSVVVIEHNLQVILASDYLIDLGPGGGDEGGRVVGVGTPKQLSAKNLPHTSSYLSEILN